MLWPVGLMLGGLVLLVGGGNVLIRSVSALAEAAGISRVVIGLTVVAFGTSLPELVVNTLAARSGETSLAFGSIVGSCTLNIGWVLAVTALVSPLVVEKSIITRELPMMLLAVAAMVVLTLDQLISSAPGSHLDRSDGIMLLLLFGVFLYYTINGVINAPRSTLKEDPLVEELIERQKRRPRRPLLVHALLSAGGIAALAIGGRLTVSGAVDVAQRLGIGEVIIGLTIVSFGTTLPELTTGILAARRGEGDIALGNVVGSNIFNILAIGGTVAVIRPVDLPAGGLADLVFLALLSLLLLPIAIRGPRRITRAEGALMLAMYLSYIGWRLAVATGA